MLISTFNGKGISVFDVFFIPAWKTPNLFLTEIFHQSHTYISYAVIAIVGLHILAALKHHFLLKDNVLRRMLPVKLK
jgi:cytochrome b561